MNTLLGKAWKPLAHVPGIGGRTGEIQPHLSTKSAALLQVARPQGRCNWKLLFLFVLLAHCSFALAFPLSVKGFSFFRISYVFVILASTAAALRIVSGPGVQSNRMARVMTGATFVSLLIVQLASWFHFRSGEAHEVFKKTIAATGFGSFLFLLGGEATALLLVNGCTKFVVRGLAFTWTTMLISIFLGEGSLFRSRETFAATAAQSENHQVFNYLGLSDSLALVALMLNVLTRTRFLQACVFALTVITLVFTYSRTSLLLYFLLGTISITSSKGALRAFCTAANWSVE